MGDAGRSAARDRRGQAKPAAVPIAAVRTPLRLICNRDTGQPSAVFSVVSTECDTWISTGGSGRACNSGAVPPSSSVKWNRITPARVGGFVEARKNTLRCQLLGQPASGGAIALGPVN